MTTSSDFQLLSAFVDGSLLEDQRLAVQALVEHSPDLRSVLRDIYRVRAEIHAYAQHYRASQALRARIDAGVNASVNASVNANVNASASRNAGASKPAAGRGGLGGLLHVSGWNRVFGWNPLGAAVGFAALLVCSLALIQWQSHDQQRMMQAAVASHLRAGTGARLVEVASSDRKVVQPWLAARMAFARPVAVPEVASADLVGARADSLEGRSVAAVVYRLREHIVNTYIWPAQDDRAEIRSASLEGMSVSHWSRGGFRYCVVSDLPPAQVLAFAQSLTEQQELR